LPFDLSCVWPELGPEAEGDLTPLCKDYGYVIKLIRRLCHSRGLSRNDTDQPAANCLLGSVTYVTPAHLAVPREQLRVQQFFTFLAKRIA
jgi:hypothetical protein